LAKIGVGEKLMAASAVVGLIFTIAVSVFVSNSITSALDAQVMEQQLHTAQMRLDEIDKFMYERMVDIRLLGSSNTLSDPHATEDEKLEFLREFGRQTEAYASISLYSRNGTRLMDTRSFGIGLDQSERPFIKSALEGDVYYDKVPTLSETLTVPVIRFSSPIYDENGSISGVVATRVLASRLGQVMGVDEDDYVEIIAPDGQLVFSTVDKKGELEESRDIALLMKTQPEMLGGSPDLVLGSNSTSVLAHEKGYLGFSGNGWTIYQRVENSQALAQVMELRQRIALLGVVGTFFMATVFYFLSLKLVIEPVLRLHRTAESVETGNYSARSGIKSDDELGELSGAFDRAIARLEKTEDERRQLEHAKTEFMSITSHELRSPMTPMKAQLQMLLAGYCGKLGRKQRESLAIVLRNTERLDKIILEMLEISRIEAARLKFNFVKGSVMPTIKSVAAEVRHFMPEKKVAIEVRTGRMPDMMLDPDRLGQVLRNLLTNAIKFSRERGKVVVSAERRKDHVEITVQDFGIGIDAKGQERIFEPFFQVEPALSRKFGGTGLGLAICKGIVEAQGGKIWFVSAPGKGTAFHFTLPLKPAAGSTPIKIAFSSRGDFEAGLKKLFSEKLGPMGEKEFTALRMQGELDYKSIREYLKEIEAQGVIDNKTENDMEFAVLGLLAPKKKDAGKEGKGT